MKYNSKPLSAFVHALIWMHYGTNLDNQIFNDFSEGVGILWILWLHEPVSFWRTTTES